MDCVENQLEVNMRGRVVLDGVLREVVQARLEAFEKLEAKVREEQLAQEAAQALVDGKSGEENTTSAEAPTVTITEVGNIFSFCSLTLKDSLCEDKHGEFIKITFTLINPRNFVLLGSRYTT